MSGSGKVPRSALETPAEDQLLAKTSSVPLARVLTLLVVALLVFLMVFSPLRSWMEFQQQARELAARIDQVKNENTELEAEIRRYQDPDYISRQARERLGYVKPGEVTYVVLDPPNAQRQKLTSGWIEKDTNDLPWFSQISSALREVAEPGGNENANSKPESGVSR